MEEQPREGPAEQPNQGSDEQPKIFKSINGWIAGATGLVIALGGLATAYRAITDDKPAAQQEGAATTTDGLPVKDAPTVQATEVGMFSAGSERPRLYTGVLFADGKFAGGAMSLKHNGENWILTADQAYEYEQIASSDKDNILAYNAEYGSYLRWPADGGEVLESVDGKKHWAPYAKVTASEPSPK